MQSPTNGASVFDAAKGFLRDRKPLAKAKWMAVQVEPIRFSGERITVAVAVAQDDGPAQVVCTLNADALESVFGRYGQHLLTMSDSIIAELQAHLAVGGRLDSWSPTLSGVYSGKVISTRNVSLQAIITSALTHTSLFSAKGNDFAHREPVDRSLARFQSEIKRIVTASRDGFSGRFNRPINLYGRKSRTTISYVGTHLAINLSTIDPTQTSHAQQCAVAQRKINQLLRLRDISIGHEYSELLLGIWTPPRELSPQQEDLLDAYTTELEFAAKRAEISFEVAHGATPMSETAMTFARKILADE